MTSVAIADLEHVINLIGYISHFHHLMCFHLISIYQNTMSVQEEEILIPENMDETNEAFQASIYLFKANSRNTRERSEICSKLTIKSPERRH